MSESNLQLAIGPKNPGVGSWEWLGADLLPVLAQSYSVQAFERDELPSADVILFIKHLGSGKCWTDLPKRTHVIYAPVDRYHSAAEIVADATQLARCSRIVIHCERLRPYFETYAPVVYMDHHLKFVSPYPNPHRASGPILWVGFRDNIVSLARWVNQYRLPRELLVLTNPTSLRRSRAPRRYGFSARSSVRIDVWSPEHHLQSLGTASAAIDIKGDDFQSTCKPPAKALDFIASGLPLAMNLNSSPVEHIKNLGFEVASPHDPRWLSMKYWQETAQFGASIRNDYSMQAIATRWQILIQQILCPTECCLRTKRTT